MPYDFVLIFVSRLLFISFCRRSFSFVRHNDDHCDVLARFRTHAFRLCTASTRRHVRLLYKHLFFPLHAKQTALPPAVGGPVRRQLSRAIWLTFSECDEVGEVQS